MIKIKWYGTASIMIDIDGEKLLFDPFFRWNKKLEKPSLEEFCNVDIMLNTHPHLDHTCDLPKILASTDAVLFAPPQTIECMKKYGVDEEKMMVIHPSEQIKTPNTLIKIHESKHVKFDFWLILKTVFRVIFTFQFKDAIKLLKLNRKFKMKNQIYAYEILADNKKIFLMGSAGKMKNYKYPTDIDILVLPFQGRSNMARYSLSIIEKIKPKTIILDHFDNAYPPITKHIDTSKFIKLMKDKHPEITVIEPRYSEGIDI